MFLLRIKRKITSKVIKILSLLLIMSLLFAGKSLALQDTTSFILDFEEDLEYWESYRVTEGSELVLEVYPEEDDILGNKSVKLIDNSIYRFRFNKTGVSLKMTSETYIDFQWMFESTSGGAYAGLRLYTYNFGSLYIYSYFQGWFANTSYAGILEIYGEETNLWYSHSIDLNEAYIQIFGEIPNVIDFIDLINYPIGGGSNPTGQITLFDNIIISTQPQPIAEYPLIGLYILVPLMVCLIYYKNRRGRRM